TPPARNPAAMQSFRKKVREGQNRPKSGCNTRTRDTGILQQSPLPAPPFHILKAGLQQADMDDRCASTNVDKTTKDPCKGRHPAWNNRVDRYAPSVLPRLFSDAQLRSVSRPPGRRRRHWLRLQPRRAWL